MPKMILHADDSPSVRHWVAEQLHDLNVKIVSVADGEAALQTLGESSFDLLLTDLEMPHLDGLELAAAVRVRPASRFLPVLIFSTREPCEIAPERLQGITGWIVKPTDPERLRRWIRRSLPR